MVNPLPLTLHPPKPVTIHSRGSKCRGMGYQGCNGRCSIKSLLNVNFIFEFVT